MEKLLHERLREYEKQRDNLFFEFGDGSAGFASFSTYEASKLADEIERTYTPLLRDEKGEPWRIGDPFVSECGVEVRSHRVEGIRHVMSELLGDFWSLVDEHGVSHEVAKCKRPTPKVCDADGAPCKTNDEVWSTSKEGVYEEGDTMIVVGIDAGVKERQVLVRRALGGAGEVWVNADALTHERPVFDAEGVRICKGDTVWTINVPKGHTKCTVKGFKTFDEIGTTDCDKPSTHAVLFEEGGWMGNLRVTHREPDSPERIIHDICEYCKLGSTDTCDAAEFLAKIADRADLIERGA